MSASEPGLKALPRPTSRQDRPQLECRRIKVLETWRDAPLAARPPATRLALPPPSPLASEIYTSQLHSQLRHSTHYFQQCLQRGLQSFTAGATMHCTARPLAFASLRGTAARPRPSRASAR